MERIAEEGRLGSGLGFGGAADETPSFEAVKGIERGNMAQSDERKKDDSVRAKGQKGKGITGDSTERRGGKITLDPQLLFPLPLSFSRDK